MMDRPTAVMTKTPSAVIMKEVQTGKDVAKFRSAQLAEHTRKNPPASDFYLGTHSSDKGDGGLRAVR